MFWLMLVCGILSVIIGVAVLLGPEGLTRARQATRAIFIGLAVMAVALMRIFLYAATP